LLSKPRPATSTSSRWDEPTAGAFPGSRTALTVVRPSVASDAGVDLVASKPAVLDLAATLLQERHVPCVVLTELASRRMPVLPLKEVRRIVGADARVYLVTDHCLRGLRTALGSRLAVGRGTARIYWPGFSMASDEFDHPPVAVLEDEPVERSLAEFARQFDFSRPHIRREIKRIDELRTAAEQKNTELKRRLRSKDAELQRLERELATERTSLSERRRPGDQDTL
jgi:hypothetical protein